ncbi:hypothetical protein AVEN_124249-1 [Araneus ventricosus]|uniref:Uncharacterized protein n=1 Tax=Araneus ventricosus TaxID=182803 RepID=A0A4Y2N1L1_ARAVE|nr:hypothetical protein AVEN_124249-1 [Araneus ventricosus]
MIFVAIGDILAYSILVIRFQPETHAKVAEDTLKFVAEHLGQLFGIFKCPLFTFSASSSFTLSISTSKTLCHHPIWLTVCDDYSLVENTGRGCSLAGLKHSVKILILIYVCALIFFQREWVLSYETDEE